MENPERTPYSNKTITRQQEGGTDENPGGRPESDSNQQEALDFVEKNRDLFEHFARGQIHCKPAPPGLNTFAFDLNTDDLYISPRFFKERGFSEEQTTFATLHEIEHLLEKKKILTEKDGPRAFSQHLSRLEKSRAYKVMDNCLADIRENETVVSKTNRAFGDIERKMYREDLFKETDFTKEPKHLQLPMALLREARVPDEICTVAPEVRAAMDEIKATAASDGTKLMDIIKHPDTSMSARLKIQDKYIWPHVKKLLEQDEKEGTEDMGDGGEESGSGEDEKKADKKQEKGAHTKDPNKRFEKSYDKADAATPHAIPVEDMKKTFRDWEKGKGNPLDTADQEYADKLDVKKEDLQRYRALAEEMRSIMNPETQQSVIDDLRDIIARIIARRKKERLAPQYPVEEGDDLADPAELVSQAKAGNFEPKAWETQEVKVEKGKRFGKVEITLIGDRSTSMKEGSKKHEQQKAVVLFMEALKEFGDLAREETANLTKPLSVQSEIYTFQSSAEDATPVKRMSEELPEKERITVATKLGSCSGSTTDFVPLESILGSIDEEKKRLIQEGELKKIVIVFTDGGSDDAARVSLALERLREAGIIIVGVGITQGGAPALTTYAPGAHLAETAEMLPNVLAETLREHLADI